jgi:hypothetical protein
LKLGDPLKGYAAAEGKVSTVRSGCSVAEKSRLHWHAQADPHEAIQRRDKDEVIPSRSGAATRSTEHDFTAALRAD